MFGNQKGIAHILVLIAAVGIVAFILLSASGQFKSNIFSALFPKPSSQAAGGFFESFAYGALPGATPMPFHSARWILIPDHNDGLITHNAVQGLGVSEYETWEDIEAAHGPHCEAPFANANPANNIHILPRAPGQGKIPTDAAGQLDYITNVLPQTIYICNNHMMTVEKDGTGATSFMPRYAMDWSGGRTQTVEFDVNPFSTARVWWDFYIAPFDQFTLDTRILSQNAVVFGFQGGAPIVKEVVNFHPVAWGDGHYFYGYWQGYCNAVPDDPACSQFDTRIRRHFKISFDINGFTYSITKPDGTLYTTGYINFPQPLSFTSGVGMMSDWTYNPTKDSPFESDTTLSTDPKTGQPTANTGLTYGIPTSLFSYHWANFAFDGPANPLMTGYVPGPYYANTNTGETQIDASGNYVHTNKNPTDPIHINITSSDLRNPHIWGELGDATQCWVINGIVDNTTCPSPSHTDQGDTTHWAQVSINGGPWLDIPSVRPQGTDFVDESNAINIEPSMTFRAALPAGSIHQGDNTVQFKSQAPSDGFLVNYFEIQVDPNADLPSNSTQCSGSEQSGTGSCVVASSSPSPLPTPTSSAGTGGLPTPTPTANPTPSPTPTSTPGTGGVCQGFCIDFNSHATGVLSGQFPTGLVDWGTNAWIVAGPYAGFTTNSISYNGAGPTSASFTFVNPFSTLVSVDVTNGRNSASTVTIACAGNTTKSQSVATGQTMTIQTGWTRGCTTVTLTSSNGWEINFDNLVTSFASDATPSPVPPTPSPTPGTTPIPGDINGSGRVDIFDYNLLVGDFGCTTGTCLRSDINANGRVDIFDYNLLVGNFGRTQ